MNIFWNRPTEVLIATQNNPAGTPTPSSQIGNSGIAAKRSEKKNVIIVGMDKFFNPTLFTLLFSSAGGHTQKHTLIKNLIKNNSH